MSFAARLWSAVERKGTPAMVGLDPRPGRFPEPFRSRAVGRGAASAAAAMRDYHRALLELLAPLVPAVKPNTAFFEELGPEGFRALADCVEHARRLGLIVVMDAKRGDIGSTAEAYAATFLGGGYEGAFPAADALTIHPYLGSDSIAPFLQAASTHGAGLFVLVRTSNPGADEFQGHGTPPLAQRVAAAVTRWGAEHVDESGWSSVGAVVGATRPAELSAFRALMPRAPFLLPGFGFQGGEPDGLAPAFDAQGRGALVNASRSILWAHERKDLQHLPTWEARVEAAVREMVGALRSVTSGAR